MKIKEQLKRIEWLRIGIREIKSRYHSTKRKLSFVIGGGVSGQSSAFI